MTLESLRKKKIIIAGMGVNNRKMADYFSAHQINFDKVENWSSPDELKNSFEGYEIIFRTPGLPYLSDPIQMAKNAGVEISSQTKLFFELCPATIIGITGTKGKGTTSSLLFSILKSAGKKVFLAGNFGRDPFEFLDELTTNDLVVMELSSFQLQDLDKSPHIAVLLNITPDHLDHHSSMTEYTEAKSHIIKYQKSSDVAILAKELPEEITKLTSAKKILIEAVDSKDFDTKLFGEFNKVNISAAVAVARELGIEESVVRQAIAEFEPLPHRLHTILEAKGVTFVDDSFSTNIESSIAAIQSIPTGLVLIVGGTDKGLDWTKLGDALKKSTNVKGLVVIGSVKDKIIKAIAGYTGRVLTDAQEMSEIVAQAISLAMAGDTVLLSPGTSSFDMFKSATDRAEQFIAEVNKLKS